MTQSHRISLLARALIKKASLARVRVATAESCTGGMITAALTDVPGSSAVLDRGFVTYSNEAKNEMLGVPMPLIERHGAVSPQVARAMAHGALKNSHAELTLSVTGIAGPDGGTDDKPVGLVWFGLASEAGLLRTERRVFVHRSREVVRIHAVETALRLLLSNITT